MKMPKVPSPDSFFDIRFDGKKHSRYECSKSRVDTVDRAVIANIESWEKIIIDLLAFRTRSFQSKNARTWNAFVPILQRVFTEWSEIPQIRVESEIADIVLSAYLQQGKVQDYIGKVSAFIERIGSIDDPDKVRFTVYNNYLFFMQQFIWDMNRKVTNVETDGLPPLQNVDLDTVAWFIHDECQSVSYIRDIPKAYSAMKRLKGSLEIGTPMSIQQVQDKTTVALCVDILLENVPDEDVTEMRRIDGMISERILSMRNNVNNAKTLYEAINSCFDDEWFDQVNPEHEKCIINDLCNDELEFFYKSKIDEFQCVLRTIEIQE